MVKNEEYCANKIFPLIIRVAFLKNGLLYIGWSKERHHHVINRFKGFLKNSIQGFFTSDGNFVTREEAAKIAFLSNQILIRKNTLYSEDIW